MLINELQQSGGVETQSSSVPAYESPESPLYPQLEAGLIQTHGGATRVVATGDGFRIVEPIRRPRYRQGV